MVVGWFLHVPSGCRAYKGDTPYSGRWHTNRNPVADKMM